MLAKQLFLPVVLSATLLGGCGIRVPEIRDFPLDRTETSNNLLVQAIITSIHCEIKDAVTKVINNDLQTGPANGYLYAQFLKHWGAEVALTLTLEERSSANPTGLWTPVSPITSVFTLNGGVSGIADGTRIDKINYYYKVSELYLGRNGKCYRDANPPRDSLLIQSDLKLGEWLDAMVTGVASGHITAVDNTNVLSHQITFQVDTTGNVTPTWKLVSGTVNDGGTFLSASRSRKHDLTITFAPLDKAKSGNFLIPIAENTHNTLQLQSGLQAGLRPLR